MACTTCQDACCRFGVDIDVDRVRAIERYREELENYLGILRSDWFREDPEDFGIQDEHEYPGGKYTRTQVVDLPAGRSPHSTEACIFLDPQSRGCRLHRFALERGIDVHEIKPLICLIFPVSFEDGVLEPPIEFEEPGDLVCAGAGRTAYRGARDELLYYFGSEFVSELDAMEREALREQAVPARRIIPLPVYAD
jgi:Fe-S-cluster containining protein